MFIGHGSPMNAIENNEYTRVWRNLGERFKPQAIIVISGHWFTDGIRTQSVMEPEKINDMYGFPEELYQLRYPVSGDKDLTEQLLKLLPGTQIDDTWGIDHGAWSILVHMYPEADVPVVQLSVNREASPAIQYEVGQKLKDLRDQGYMIIGSGNVVHNLREMDFRSSDPRPWAKSFDDHVESWIQEGLYEKVIDYLSFGQEAKASVPTPEHFYPLLSILGAAEDNDQLEVFNKAVELGSVSMTSYLFY